MKIVKGKIISAKRSELIEYYISREMDDIYSLPDYIERMKSAGVIVKADTERTA